MRDPRLAPALGDDPAARAPRRSRATRRARPAADTSASSNSLPRHHRNAPNSADRDHEEADADHDAEREEHRRRPAAARAAARSSGPGNSPFGSCVRMSEAPRGIEISKRFVSVFSSGQAKMWKSPGLRAVPVRLHGGDLDRLVLERVEPVLVADEELQRRQHREHADRHAHHGARLRSRCVPASR